MKIVLTPRDNPEAIEEIPLDLTDLWVGEVKLLEKVLKQTIVEIGTQLEAGSFTHMCAMIWIYRRRSNRELRLDDIDDQVRVSELDVVNENDDEQVEIPKDSTTAAPSEEESSPVSPPLSLTANPI